MENTYQPTEAEKKAIKIMLNEKSNWQEGTVFVTPKVAFDTKKMVEKCRKNYYGIFNEGKDPVTKRDKIFIPFTEWIVETILKNIDIDTKDINVKAKNPSSYKIANIFRYVLRKKLEDVSFGKTINKLLKRVCIDGTGFLKIYRNNGKLQIDVVDRLNMLYDPSAETLDQSSGIIERNVLRIGRKIAVVAVLAATIHLLLAPYFYVKGILVWGNSMTDLGIYIHIYSSI